MQDTNFELDSMNLAEPYNMEAEQSVLGAALLDSERVMPALINTLKPEMFYSRQNAEIFSQMVELYSGTEQRDGVTLIDALASTGVFESMEAAKVYIARLGEVVPSISNFSAYARIVEEKYLTRQVMQLAQNILKQSSAQPDADMLLESVEQRLTDIRSNQKREELTKLSDAFLETMATLQKIAGPNKDKYAGIPTGFTYLDSILTGLGRSDLIILAARPGMGKTSFALNIATNVAKKSHIPVAIFSLEMSKEQLTNRILSAEAGVDSHSFRSGALSGNDWDDLAHAMDVLHDVPIFMDDTSGITIPEVKAKIRKINQDPEKTPIGLVVIDYLQLMTSGKRTENRVQEISDITRNLKIMAKELNVPVIALSQLSRAAEKSSGRSDHRPQLSDLRDSGSIEQDADIVLFLYREGYYTSMSGESLEESDSSTAECIIAKNRHGETGKVDLGWDGAHTRFVNVDYNHAG